MRLITLFGNVVLVVTLAVLAGCGPMVVTVMPPHPPTLDEDEIAIESPVAKELLGRNTIKIRRRATTYQPSGMLPVIQLEEVTDWECRATLDKLRRRYPSEVKVYYMRDILAAKGEAAVFWVSRASGAFKYTRTAASMVIPAQINPEEAVQMALHHLGEQRLIRLQKGEEVDLLFVTEVHNRVTRVGDEELSEGFVSDYYVGFGRRYQGVPIIGSRLVVQLDGNGNVTMVEGQWRRIQPESAGEVYVGREQLGQLIVNDPQFQRHFEGRPAPWKITVLDMKCGYIEAPPHFRQQQLRPGCQVAFQVGEGADEEPSQLTLSLEIAVGRETLMGTKFDGLGR